MDAVTEKPDDLVARYRELRTGKEEADERYAAWLAETYSEPMKQIEAQLLTIMNTLGSTSIKTPHGTAMKVNVTSLKTVDASAFRRHIIGLEAWDMVDWKPNKTAIDELVDKDGVLPPGIDRTVITNIRIRKA